MTAGDVFALLAIVGFAISVIAIWTEHSRKVMELKLKLRAKPDASVESAVESLREEVRALRDTSMQYDISFDAAVQRLEQRVVALEARRSDERTVPADNLRKVL